MGTACWDNGLEVGCCSGTFSGSEFVAVSGGNGRGRSRPSGKVGTLAAEEGDDADQPLVQQAHIQ